MFYSKKLNKFKNIKHCFFSRKGGFSKGNFKSLNCGRGSKDNKINIQIAYYGIDDTIDLYNIEMPKFESQKWTNLIITVDNKIVNVYKNGLIYTSKKLFNPNVKKKLFLNF